MTNAIGVARLNSKKPAFANVVPPRCQMAAICNLMELDGHMQPELLFANVDDVFGVARPTELEPTFADVIPHRCLLLVIKCRQSGT